MNNDNKNDPQPDSEDAFYESDYDEDTVDYDLDSDSFLAEEELKPEPTESWENESGEPEIEPAAVFAPESGYDQEPDPEEEWYDEDEQELPEDEYIDSWPLGLIAVGIIALLLLAAGGYGVLQQRTEMQEEIRQLRATLSTTSSNTELAASRQAQRSIASHNTELQAQLERLQLENQALREELSSPAPAKKGEAAKAEPAKPPPPVPATKKPPPREKVKPLPDSKPAPPATKAKVEAASSTTASWFVNFGSYSQEAMARSWASRLKVDTGRVIVMPGQKGTSHFYRVRVIDLPNREIAGKIALQLEQTYKLPRLWVGKQ